MKNFLNRFYLITVIVAICCHPGAMAQKKNKNATRFIEPNVSVSYDSNLYSLSEPYGSFNTRQGFDFKLRNDNIHRPAIHIEANISGKYPGRSSQDSAVLSKIEIVKKERSKAPGRVPVLEETVRDVHGFSCLGIVMYDSATKKHTTIISGLRLFEGGYSDFRYYSFQRNDLKTDYEILSDLLSGWRSYTPEEIEREEADMKKKYVVTVDSIALTPQELQNREYTFAAIVRVSPQPPNGIFAAMVRNNLFNARTRSMVDGGVKITCKDYEPGKITHQGQLFLLNSFGKTVKFPFTIAYTNKGLK